MSLWERDNTAPSMRGIHDTTEVRETDGEMEIFLHDLARKENSDFIRKIADRFAMLTAKAHNRKHWTGTE
tara:strand:+ start:548 stop:757 length:210 start_codon:yes stop_codon:yes gene_type:complete